MVSQDVWDAGGFSENLIQLQPHHKNCLRITQGRQQRAAGNDSGVQTHYFIIELSIHGMCQNMADPGWDLHIIRSLIYMTKSVVWCKGTAVWEYCLIAQTKALS